MYGIKFDNDATPHIIWLFTSFVNQYQAIDEDINIFQLCIDSILELITRAVLETLDRYLTRYEDGKNKLTNEFKSEYIIDFRYQYNGKIALEIFSDFINSIDDNVDIYKNPDGGEFYNKTLIPIYTNLKEITQLLFDDETL